MNGDGLDDLLIGAPLGGTGGAAYLLFGSQAGLGSALDIAALDGTNGFRIPGGTGAMLGLAVAGLGDVNGDGFADILVGGDGADPDNRGQSYVIFGTDAPQSADFDTATLDGNTGFQMIGLDPGARTGAVAASAGDLNGDGFDDFVLGGMISPADAGGAYVVFGQPGGQQATLPLDALDGTNGFRLPGLTAGDNAGSDVAGAGDINGDGLADLLIGADGAFGMAPASGQVYVLFGKVAGFAADIDLDTLDGTNGFVVLGAEAFDALGVSVSAAGDVNGDGFGDFILGADRALVGGAEQGCAYVVFGAAHWASGTFDVGALTGGNGFALLGEADNGRAGLSVSSAGDVNGDGYDDLLVGAPQAAEGGVRGGSAYVVFGAAGGFLPALDLGSLNGANGFQLRGTFPSGDAGWSVAAAGDVNGDGFDDILVGSPGDGAGGASYLIYGKATRATAGDDLLSATDAADLLSGLRGRDTLLGFGGQDTLAGGAGADLLDGGIGLDSLYGGAGNDTFVLDVAGDVLFGSSGIDTVRSGTLSLNLGAAGFSLIENAELTGLLARNLTGTPLDNRLTGNAGANTLNGAGGADTLTGGDGNDIYVTDGGDTILEAAGQGQDTVRASADHVLAAEVEALILTGSAALAGTGNALANTLTGNGGDNVLNGGLGVDTLTGGQGRDSFVFSTALGAANIDRITDFSVAADTIRLEDAIFAVAAALPTGEIAAAAFAITATGAALDGTDRILYQPGTGRLFYDSDGIGGAAAVHFATLAANLALTQADFWVV